MYIAFPGPGPLLTPSSHPRLWLGEHLSRAPTLAQLHPGRKHKYNLAPCQKQSSRLPLRGYWVPPSNQWEGSVPQQKNPNVCKQSSALFLIKGEKVHMEQEGVWISFGFWGGKLSKCSLQGVICSFYDCLTLRIIGYPKRVSHLP